MTLGQRRIVRRYAILPYPVNRSRTSTKTVWVWLRSYYVELEYQRWNDWTEGIGNHWKTSWRTVREFRDK